MTGAKTAVEWLASVAPAPRVCRRAWQRDPSSAALLPAGRAWDVLVLPAGLGCPTLDVLTRVLDRVDPVPAGFGDGRIGFPVPPGTAERRPGTGTSRPKPAPGSWCRTRGAGGAAARAADTDLVLPQPRTDSAGDPHRRLRIRPRRVDLLGRLRKDGHQPRPQRHVRVAGDPAGNDNAQCAQTVSVQPDSQYTLSGHVRGSYVYLGASGTGATDVSTWTRSAADWQQLTTTFRTGAQTTEVTVYTHGWYGTGFGMPASTQAGNGYVAPAEAVKALDCLTKKADCGPYTTHGTWPALRGLMTWSINWDRFSNWQFQHTFDGYFG